MFTKKLNLIYLLIYIYIYQIPLRRKNRTKRRRTKRKITKRKRTKRRRTKRKRRRTRKGGRVLTSSDVSKFNAKRRKKLKKDDCDKYKPLINNLSGVTTDRAEKILKVLQGSGCEKLISNFSTEMNKKMMNN